MSDQTNLWLERRFEDLYKEHHDPWGCTAGADSINNELFLAMIKAGREKWRWVLDIGCGLGAFSSKIADATSSMVIGIDVSETAVRQAEDQHYGGCVFACRNILTDKINDLGVFDLVVMSEVLWYVCDQFDIVLEKIKAVMSAGGMLAIHQYFPEDQKYYKDFIDGMEGFKKRMDIDWELKGHAISYWQPEGPVMLALYQRR